MGRKPIARIGPYTVVSELGRGGMGVVYRARHKDINRDIALKMISRDAGATEEQIERFKREAEAASTLASHPNIVGVHDVGEDDGVLYLAMDLIEGRPLDDLAAEGELRLEDVARIGEQIAQALAHAHANDILHRDVKPANILVTDHLSAHLTDFGLARANATDSSRMKLTVSGELLGTPAYMPPEQARGEDVDERADIYSLGASLYELASGEPPFKGGSIYTVIGQVLKKPPVPLRKINENIPKDLETIILNCMQKAPRMRYQSATQLADDLGRFRLGASITVRASAVQRGMRAAATSGSKRGWVIAAATVLLLAGGGAGAWALWGGGDGGGTGKGDARSGKRGSSAGSKRSSRAKRLSAVYTAVAEPTAAAMQRLEDRWAGADIDDQVRDDALAQIASVTRAAAKKHKSEQLPAAWRGLARWFAGEGGPALDAIRNAAERAKQDPYPHVLLARAELAGWAAAAAPGWPEIGLIDGWIGAPEPGETDAQQAARKTARSALAEAAKIEDWRKAAAGRPWRQFADAARRLADGKFGEAAGKLAALREDAGLGPAAALLQGGAHAAAGQHAEAAEAFAAAGTARDWPLAWLLAGRAHLAAAGGAGDAPATRGALTAAGEAFDAAVKAGAGRADAARGRAVVAWALAGLAQEAGEDPDPHLDRAFAQWQIVLEVQPDDAETLRHLGQATIRRADRLAGRASRSAVPLFRTGLDHLERAQRGDTASPATAAALAEALVQHGLNEQAQQRDPQVHWRRSEQLLQEQRREHPAHAGLAYALGRLYAAWTNNWKLPAGRKLEMLGEAVRALRSGAEHRPGRAAIWRQLGHLHNDRGLLLTNDRDADPFPDFRAAIRDYSKSLELVPDDPDARRGRGGARVNMGNALSDRQMDPTGAYQAGKEDLDALLSRRPDDLAGHLFRGHCTKSWARWLDHTGRDNRAQLRQCIEDYTFVIGRQPENLGVLVNLGGSQINLGLRVSNAGEDPVQLYDDGVRTLTQALKVRPNHWQALWFRANGYNNKWVWERSKQRGDVEDARRALTDYLAAVQQNARLDGQLRDTIERLKKEIAETGG